MCDKKSVKVRKREIVISRVKELRELKKETQIQFAENIGVSPNTVSRIERKEMSLSSEVALKISDAYRVSLDWLFLRSDENLSPKYQAKVKEAFAIMQEQELVDYEKPKLKINRAKKSSVGTK